MHMGSDLHKAILEGAGEIAVPALVSTLCICIVFVPMFFLSGVARYLFAPLAEAVVFAMLASYVLSRTLVPTLVMLLMDHAPGEPGGRQSLLQRVYRRIQRAIREDSQRLCSHSFGGARKSPAVRGLLPGFLRAVLLSGVHPGPRFLSQRGRRPDPPAHARAHRHAHRGNGAGGRSGRRRASEPSFRPRISARCSTIWAWRSAASTRPTATPGPSAARTARSSYRSMRDTGRRSSTWKTMRRELPRRFPGVEFFFQPADMVTQILNFGLPSAIDVKITGADLRADYDIAAKLMKQMQMIPGTVDTHIQQRSISPRCRLNMDRTQLQQLGLSPNDVTNDLLVSTAGTSQTSPAFWLSPANGIVYNLAVQSPQYAVDSLDALLRTPVRAASAALSTHAAAAEQSCRRRAGGAGGGRVALQPGPDHRHLCQRAGPRHGWYFHRYPAIGRRAAPPFAARRKHRDPRPDGNHEVLVHRAGSRVW